MISLAPDEAAGRPRRSCGSIRRWHAEDSDGAGRQGIKWRTTATADAPQGGPCGARAKNFRRCRARVAWRGSLRRPLPFRTNLPDAQAKGVSANREAADAFPANVLSIVRQIQAAGATTFRAMATALNDRGVRTGRLARQARCVICRRGRRWRRILREAASAPSSASSQWPLYFVYRRRTWYRPGSL
jgi:hypothetical protein